MIRQVASANSHAIVIMPIARSAWPTTVNALILIRQLVIKIPVYANVLEIAIAKAAIVIKIKKSASKIRLIPAPAMDRENAITYLAPTRRANAQAVLATAPA